MTDVLGSVFGVARANGTSSKIATFTDFGEYVGNQHPSSVFGFTGEVQDAASSRVDFLARSYEASTGRFLQRDRAGQDVVQPATFHPYPYAFAAPTTYSDYLGNWGINWGTVAKVAAAVVVAAVVTAVVVAAAPVVLTAVGVSAAAVAAGTAGATAVALTATVAGGVAGGIAYRALDGQTRSQIFSPKAMAVDAVISGVTFGLGKALAPAARSVTVQATVELSRARDAAGGHRAGRPHHSEEAASSSEILGLAAPHTKSAAIGLANTSAEVSSDEGREPDESARGRDRGRDRDGQR